MQRRPLTFTIVGSRKASEEHVERLYNISLDLLRLGGIGYSGNAPGPDFALTRAALKHQEETGMPGELIAKIFLPQPDREFNGYSADDPSGLFHSFYNEKQKQTAALVARVARLGFYGLNESGRNLHTRNTLEVLGEFMNEWSHVLICAAPLSTKGYVVGGTATAVRIAQACHIPVINLVKDDGEERLERLMTYLSNVGNDWDRHGIATSIYGKKTNV